MPSRTDETPVTLAKDVTGRYQSRQSLNNRPFGLRQRFQGERHLAEPENTRAYPFGNVGLRCTATGHPIMAHLDGSNLSVPAPGYASILCRQSACRRHSRSRLDGPLRSERGHFRRHRNVCLLLSALVQMDYWVSTFTKVR